MKGKEKERRGRGGEGKGGGRERKKERKKGWAHSTKTRICGKVIKFCWLMGSDTHTS